MWRKRLVDHHPARHREHPGLRLLLSGVVLELVWALGLLVMLGVLSVVLWAVINKIAAI